MPDGVSVADLDPGVRRDLRGLQKDTADAVALHLVAAGTLVDDDPQRALEHARFARRRAARIAAVREAAGIAAYHAGEWSEALAELRAARRMGGGPGHLAVMADIERALGRPERALELTRGPEAAELGAAESIELVIVAAGARRDLGELDAAVVGLQIAELDPARRASWSARLFYAYADNLLAAGREADALQWFMHAADADDEGETDAAVRIAELTGEPIPDQVDEEIFTIEELVVAGPTASTADGGALDEDALTTMAGPVTGREGAPATMAGPVTGRGDAPDAAVGDRAGATDAVVPESTVAAGGAGGSADGPIEQAEEAAARRGDAAAAVLAEAPAARSGSVSAEAAAQATTAPVAVTGPAADPAGAAAALPADGAVTTTPTAGTGVTTATPTAGTGATATPAAAAGGDTGAAGGSAAPAAATPADRTDRAGQQPEPDR